VRGRMRGARAPNGSVARTPRRWTALLSPGGSRICDALHAMHA